MSEKSRMIISIPFTAANAGLITIIGKKSPFRHPPFAEEVRMRIREIRDALADVMPDTLQEWEDDFRRDLHWWHEMEYWERVVAQYRHDTTGAEMSSKDKTKILGIIMLSTPVTTQLPTEEEWQKIEKEGRTGTYLVAPIPN